ncbi:MAG TPA: MarR family transcriptional regulator [Fimbriimonadaceae bacterium]|nr:MarR family transcriptional regulator [Fimbriimonadaceae bacterium]
MTKTKLGECQKKAWGLLLLSHSATTRKIDAALRSEGLPSLEVYDVLLALEDAPERRMRMVDLAEAVVFSPSGLTRLIDRMVAQNFVERIACVHDRRAIYVHLTDAGLRARKQAWPRYAELIQEHFGQFLTDAEARDVAEGLSRVEVSRRHCGSERERG